MPAPRQKLQQSQRQTQTLAMTPELQQAIRLLQMSNLQLQAFVAQELERNPLLELSEDDEPQERRAANRAEEETPAMTGDENTGRESLTEAFAETAPTEERLVAMDVNPAEVFDATAPSDQPATPAAAQGGLHETAAFGGMSSASGMSGASARRGDGELPDLEATISTSKSLREHLTEQLDMELAGASPTERLIAWHLVAQLDSDGYLREPLADIAAQLGVSEAQVKDVLKLLQGLEPAGVFARDLAECFRLQLQDMGELDAPMQALLDNLELVAARDFDTLAARCGVPAARLPDLLARLKRLDPRPGAAFAAEPLQVVVPDVFVRAGPDGGWQVELNTDTLPKVLVNDAYRLLIQRPGAREQDKAFVHECATRANWLVRSLQQRARTILAVAGEIVRRQDAFLARGIAGLKPLTLKQVADALNMHESTISRVVANKYMATPRGIYEFRFFFTTALAGTDGETQVSAEAVRHRIRELIDSEPPDKVLSDDAIVKILRAEGIDIARRTVAKYREAMGIPSSPKRRREKRLAARMKG